MKSGKKWGAGLAAVLLTWAAAGVCVSVSGSVRAYGYGKAAALSVYDMFHYVEKWIGLPVLAVLAAALLVGFFMGKQEEKKDRQHFFRPFYWLVTGMAAVTGSFFLAVSGSGTVDEIGGIQLLLQTVSGLWFAGMVWYLGGWLGGKTRRKPEGAAGEGQEKTGNPGGVHKNGIRETWAAGAAVAGYLFSLLPIWIVGRFAYPQSDDFAYSKKCKQALMQGGGLWEVLQAAAHEVAESYVWWQGTFSSIYLMALQPGVWGEQYYHIVPVFLTVLLSVSVGFFLYALLVRLGKMPVRQWLLCTVLLLFVTVQRVPDQPSAFYWYNGAVHYLGAFSFLLLCFGFLLLAVTGERKSTRILCGVPACLFAVMTGGGNLVTGLLGGILFVTLCGVLYAFRVKKHRLWAVLPMLCYGIAFGVNVACPGNFSRQELSGGHFYNPVTAVLESFAVANRLLLGEWTGWLLLFLLLAVIPLVWKWVGQIPFSFPCPLLVLGYSFCMLAAMFTPQIFATGEWDIGRALNSIYSFYVLLCFLNLIYVLGWFSHRYEIGTLWKKSRYWAVLGCFAAGYFGITAIASPSDFAASAAGEALVSGEAAQWADIVEENMEILRSAEGPVAVIRRLPQEPAIFVSDQIEIWDSGTRGYFGVETVIYEDEVEAYEAENGPIGE